jgi:hypothetical protein
VIICWRSPGSPLPSSSRPPSRRGSSVRQALDAAGVDDEEPSPDPLRRDIGLHDFVTDHPKLCLAMVLVVCGAVVGAVVAFMAGWF